MHISQKQKTKERNVINNYMHILHKQKTKERNKINHIEIVGNLKIL